MKVDQLRIRIALLVMLMLSLTILGTRLRADTIGTCGGQMITIPFDDVDPANIFFCAIASAYFSGLTNGTSATTYSPADPVPREQMAAFITRTLDQSLKRGSRRAALGQFWTVSKEPSASFAGFTKPIGLVKSDGTYIYVAYTSVNEVVALPAGGAQFSGGALFYSGAQGAYGIAITPNYVYVSGRTNPGRLYRVLRQVSSSPAELMTSSLGAMPAGIAYDGERIWTANSGGNSVSIYNPTTTTTTTIPGFSSPFGMLFDGANIWITDTVDNTLIKLNQNGVILQTVMVGPLPLFPMFDGTNIWVPNSGDSTISVVRAATGQVLETLTGNGLNYPSDIAFDGQRVMVTNYFGNSLSLWRATDLTPLGSISVGFPASLPFNVCSDGQDFWVTVSREIYGTVQKY